MSEHTRVDVLRLFPLYFFLQEVVTLVSSNHGDQRAPWASRVSRLGWVSVCKWMNHYVLRAKKALSLLSLTCAPPWFALSFRKGKCGLLSLYLSFNLCVTCWGLSSGDVASWSRLQSTKISTPSTTSARCCTTRAEVSFSIQSQYFHTAAVLFGC